MNTPKKGYFLYGVLMVLILWEVLHLALHSEAVPSPLMTFKNCWVLLTSGSILIHIAASLLRLTAAISLALVVGVGIGLAMGLSKTADQLLSPVLYILFPVPKVALLPILFIFFGLGEVSKVSLIFLIVIFQITLMVRDAIHGIPANILLAAKVMHLEGFAFLRHVILPCISKTVISGTRISAGTGIAVLFFAENYATTTGLGYMIMNSWSLIDYVNLYSGIVFLSLLGGLIFYLLDLLEKRFCSWQYA